MLYADTLTLVTETRSIDASGFEVVTQTTRSVFADVKTATRSEFYEAYKAGLTVSLVATVRLCDYQGEELAQYGGVDYDVIRTYVKDRDFIELTLGKVER